MSDFKFEPDYSEEDAKPEIKSYTKQDLYEFCEKGVWVDARGKQHPVKTMPSPYIVSVLDFIWRQAHQEAAKANSLITDTNRVAKAFHALSTVRGEFAEYAIEQAIDFMDRGMGDPGWEDPDDLVDPQELWERHPFTTHGTNELARRGVLYVLPWKREPRF